MFDGCKKSEFHVFFPNETKNGVFSKEQRSQMSQIVDLLYKTFILWIIYFKGR